MEMLPYAEAGASFNSILDRVARSHEPAIITRKGLEAVVLVSLSHWNAIEQRLESSTKPPASVSPGAAATPPEGGYDIVCQIDAYENYIARINADDPRRAVDLARVQHNRYEWKHHSTEEFDARVYAALDRHGRPIEGTESGDL